MAQDSPGRDSEVLGEGPELVERAARLARAAHRGQRRTTDDVPYIVHAIEVGALLRDAGYDDVVVSAGVLHDAIERGGVSESEIREAVGDRVADLVVSLTEDPNIRGFEPRKAALREQIEAAGPVALAVFAADKLSNARSLTEGVHRYGHDLDRHLDASLTEKAHHYEESLQMIERACPDLPLAGALHAELDRLAQESPEAAHVMAL